MKQKFLGVEHGPQQILKRLPAAFADGLVDAAVCFPPESNRLLEKGGKVVFHSGQVPPEDEK